MFQTILPHYRHVKLIVQRYEVLYAKQFPQIKNWNTLGKLILLEVIQQYPDGVQDPIRLQLTYRIALAKTLALLVETKPLKA